MDALLKRTFPNEEQHFSDENHDPARYLTKNKFHLFVRQKILHFDLLSFFLQSETSPKSNLLINLN